MGTVTSSAVISFLDQLFSRWGLPRQITTDNGPQFLSSEFTTFLASSGVTHIRTSVYHPQANGGVERFNQSLKNGLRAHMSEGYSLIAALSQTLLHYRATVHSTTGVSPAALMLKRELVLPLSRLRPPMAARPRPRPTVVKTQVKRQQRSIKHKFDRRHKTKWPDISFGLGPSPPACQVSRQLGPASFQLADGSRWHASCLRRVPTPVQQPPLARATQGNPAPGPTAQVNPALAPDPVTAPPAEAVPTAQEAVPAAHRPASPPVSPPGPFAPVPRPVRAHTRPERFEDFETTFHV